jgi:hypothetical protein
MTQVIISYCIEYNVPFYVGVQKFSGNININISNNISFDNLFDECLHTDEHKNEWMKIQKNMKNIHIDKKYALVKSVKMISDDPTFTMSSHENLFSNINSLQYFECSFLRSMEGFFNNCSTLKTVILPSVTEIINSFNNLTNLKTVSLPSITTITKSFTLCDKLHYIIVNKNMSAEITNELFQNTLNVNNGRIIPLTYTEYMNIEKFSNVLEINMDLDDVDDINKPKIMSLDDDIENSTVNNFLSIEHPFFSNILFTEDKDTHDVSFFPPLSSSLSLLHTDLFDNLPLTSFGIDIGEDNINKTLSILGKSKTDIINLDSYKTNLLIHINVAFKYLKFTEIYSGFYQQSKNNGTLHQRVVDNNSENDINTKIFKLFPGDVLKMNLNMIPGNDLAEKTDKFIYNTNIILF